MKTKVFSVLLVGLILTMLILAGPAQGFTFNLTLNNSTPTEGDKITFTAEINIPSGEQLPVEYLILNLSGPESASCKFSPDGTIIEGCKGVSITQNQNSNYGYGYSYGYGYKSGKLTYTLTLDTDDYKIGKYTTSFNVKINPVFTQAGPSFEIKGKSSGGGGGWTTWECGEWSACIYGEQTRTCEKVVQNWPAAPKPETQRTCLWDELNYNEDGTIKLNDEQNSAFNQTIQNLTSTITGAATGVIGTIGTNGAIIIFIFTIAGLGFLIFFIRKFI